MRQGKIIAVVGGRGTGKTDYVKNLAKLFLQSNSVGKVLVLELFDSGVWRSQDTHNHKNGHGITILQNREIYTISQTPGGDRFYRTANPDINGAFSMATKYFWNGMIIVEDATRIIRRGKLTDDQVAMIYDSKQKGNDVVFNFHLLKRVPEELAVNLDYLVLKKTKEDYNHSLIKSKFDEPVKAAMLKVKNSKNQYETQTINLQQ